MISFVADTITVIRPAWVTQRGTLVADWAGATEHPVANCRVQPATGSELIDATRDAITSDAILYAPADADIDARDRVRAGGVTYDIDGNVRRWPSPTGELAHTEVSLTRVEG